MKSKNFLIKIRAIFILTAVCIFIPSCYVPSPLYGTWKDNYGSSIRFMSDGTFSIIIADANLDKPLIHQGDYTVIDNVISFSTNDGITVNTEWDIRGAMLYLKWTESKVTYELTLYHTSK